MDATRKSMGMIPMADLKAMQAAHKRQEERDDNRAVQHLTICHQTYHGYHIHLIIIDCLNYLY